MSEVQGLRPRGATTTAECHVDTGAHSSSNAPACIGGHAIAIMRMMLVDHGPMRGQGTEWPEPIQLKDGHYSNRHKGHLWRRRLRGIQRWYRNCGRTPRSQTRASSLPDSMPTRCSMNYRPAASPQNKGGFTRTWRALNA